MRVTALVSFLALLLPLLAQAQTVTELLEQKALQQLANLDNKLQGALGVCAIDLTNGHMLSYHAQTVFPTASMIKIPIMMTLFRAERAGQLKLTDRATIAKAELREGGELTERLKQGPVTLTIRELLTAMIRSSDNSATNKLISLLGMANVNQLLDDLGFRQTRLRRVMLDYAAAQRSEENISTPTELAQLAALIYRGQAIDAAASQDMLATMELVQADMRHALPASVRVAAKPGALVGVFGETGIVLVEGRPFALSIMSSYLAKGENPVPEVTKLFYDHFVRLAHANQYGHQLQ